MGVNPRNLAYVKPPSLLGQAFVMAFILSGGALGHYLETQEINR